MGRRDASPARRVPGGFEIPTVFIIARYRIIGNNAGMRNGIYNASIVTVSPENAPADPAIEDVAGLAGLMAYDPGYEEWVDDCERNAAAEADNGSIEP